MPGGQVQEGRGCGGRYQELVELKASEKTAATAHSSGYVGSAPTGYSFQGSWPLAH